MFSNLYDVSDGRPRFECRGGTEVKTGVTSYDEGINKRISHTPRFGSRAAKSTKIQTITKITNTTKPGVTVRTYTELILTSNHPPGEFTRFVSREDPIAICSHPPGPPAPQKVHPTRAINT